MIDTHRISELWDFMSSMESVFTPAQIANLPDVARRYLIHAIAPGTRLASAVRLRMHGEIKLKRWFPFTAEQVIAWDQGMTWDANVRMYGIPVTGFDRLIRHKGAMQWNVLGRIPLMHADGDDITRATIGRMIAESVWLPSVLCRDNVIWTQSDSEHVTAGVAVDAEKSALTLAVDTDGRLQSILLNRWGNPDGGAFGYAPFGGIAEQERTFDGYTIPTRLRVGWHFGTPRFDTEGEFFRCTIDHAEFR